MYANSRNTYSTNSTSHSTNDLVKKKKGGKRNYTPEKMILTIVAVAVVKYISQQHLRFKKKSLAPIRKLQRIR